MAMSRFLDRFPELGIQETRSAEVLPGQGLPAGQYGFIEFYCEDRNCDCRRVVISVLRPQTGRKIWATIGYGWEPAEFYDKWNRGPAGDFGDLKGPYLDEFNPQSEYSQEILEVFRTVLQSPGYVQRLEQHYRMFRGEADKKGAPDLLAVANRRKRLRDPRRRKHR